MPRVKEHVSNWSNGQHSFGAIEFWKEEYFFKLATTDAIYYLDFDPRIKEGGLVWTERTNGCRSSGYEGFDKELLKKGKLEEGRFLFEREVECDYS